MCEGLIVTVRPDVYTRQYVKWDSALSLWEKRYKLTVSFTYHSVLFYFSFFFSVNYLQVKNELN